MTEQVSKKKYRVNLPNTPFAMKASLAVKEPERLKEWEKAGLTEKIYASFESRKEKFVLHDGPPYANGHIHIGHALNKILKDIIVKYQTARGRAARYVPGWDCHGLPIEHALFKEMGKRKGEVDQVAFRKEARKYAEKFVNIQREDFKRLGIFGEWDNPYLTMSPQYQASIAKSFYELYEKKYIERGEKPIHWCFDCETALAEAELEHQDKTSIAVFVTFNIMTFSNAADSYLQSIGIDAKKQNVQFIIWTTTPWTLPANVGVALHPQLEYGLYSDNKGSIYIFATSLEQSLKDKLGFQDLKCLKTLSGEEVKRYFPKYQHPFIQERKGEVILADYVSSTDGTGIVHIAPGHGQEDYVHGHILNKLEVKSPVNERGLFTENFGEKLPLKGQHVFKGNQPIIDHLKETGHLKGSETHPHSYPHCWRCKKPVIFRSTPQWFLKIDHDQLRDRVMKVIQDPEKTTWYPDWGKNRILGMMETRPDWCLTRQRLWGVPIPLGFCKDCHEPYFTKELKDRTLKIFEIESADAWFERPKTDFLPQGAACSKCKSKNLELEQDILDVWFDSGVSHQAVLESGQKLGFPADLYLEGSDQHRGWFQTSLITSVALRDQAPFRSVLTHGFVVDGQGKKMSKSQGNVVNPQEVLKQFGADVLRLWVSSCDTDVDVRLSPEILERMSEAYRKIRNTFRYLLGNLADFDPAKHSVPFEKMDSMDKWALTRLNQIATEVIQCYEKNKFHEIYQIIYEFCITDLSSFYLDVLKDRLYTKFPDEPLRRGSQSALFVIGKTLCQLISPILVFTADEVWQSFKFGKETNVHEAVWDEKLWSFSDKVTHQHWEAVRAFRNQTDLLIEGLREKKEVGSSLDAEIVVWSKDPVVNTYLTDNKAQLKMGLIVSDFKISNESEIQACAAHNEFTWTDGQLSASVKVGVRKASGAKCARCWKYSPQVGKMTDPLLCEECDPVETALSLSRAPS